MTIKVGDYVAKEVDFTDLRKGTEHGEVISLEENVLGLRNSQGIAYFFLPNNFLPVDTYLSYRNRNIRNKEKILESVYKGIDYDFELIEENPFQFPEEDDFEGVRNYASWQVERMIQMDRILEEGFDVLEKDYRKVASK